MSSRKQLSQLPPSKTPSSAAQWRAPLGMPLPLSRQPPPLLMSRQPPPLLRRGRSSSGCGSQASHVQPSSNLLRFSRGCVASRYPAGGSFPACQMDAGGQTCLGCPLAAGCQDKTTGRSGSLQQTALTCHGAQGGDNADSYIWARFGQCKGLHAPAILCYLLILNLSSTISANSRCSTGPWPG